MEPKESPVTRLFFIGIIVGCIVVTIMAQVLPTTYEYVNAAGETITATKSWVLGTGSR